MICQDDVVYFAGVLGYALAALSVAGTTYVIWTWV